MQATNDMEFGDRFAVSRGRCLPRLFQRHSVSAGCVFLAPKRAQATGGDTDVRGINVAVDVEVSAISVQALANQIGQPTNGQHIVRTIKRQRFLSAEPLLRLYLFAYRRKARIVSLEAVEHSY